MRNFIRTSSLVIGAILLTVGIVLQATMAHVISPTSPAQANDGKSDAPTSPPLPDCYVLAVGVETYAVSTRLPGCAHDARYLAARFQGQKGKLYREVHSRVLVNEQASQQAIQGEMERLRTQGRAGDCVVLIASGHNHGRGKNWGFCSQDEKSVSGRAILSLADTLASQGKRVVVLIDACFAGGLRLLARELLIRHQDPTQGSIVLMVSSTPRQPSQILPGRNASAFCKAVDEALEGRADYNNDGIVTLRELRRYASGRVYELLEALCMSGQDAEIDASLSVSDTMPMARVTPALLRVRGVLTTESPLDGDRKAYRRVNTVTLTQGVTYTIDMESAEMDSFLRLEDATGAVLRSDDDAGGGLNARIVFTPEQTGSYRVISTTYQPNAIGAFRLTVRR